MKICSLLLCSILTQPLLAGIGDYDRSESQTNIDPCISYDFLPSARPCIGDHCQPCSYKSALEMSFLVWQARGDGLDFALKNNPRFTPSSAISTDINGKMQSIHFEWAPAYKLNWIQSFTNSWDFDIRWTGFYSRSTATSHANIDSTTGSGLYPIWVLPQIYQDDAKTYGKARGIWHVHLKTADFELGYNPFLTPNLSLRLYCGIKGISVSQQFSVKYSEGENTPLASLLPSRVATRNRCLGTGPRFGLNSMWYLQKGWYLAADAAASFALSVFNLVRKDFDNVQNNTTQEITRFRSSFRESFYVYRPIFEGLIGIGWNTCYGCRNQFSFDFRTAYEVQYYWEQNMIRQMASEQISFSAFPMRGDLHFHGITTSFSLGF